MKKITIAVDGSSLGNPGDGQFKLVNLTTHELIYTSEVFTNSTNNQMELMAVIKAVDHIIINKYDINESIVYTDSNTAIAWWRNRKIKSKSKNRKLLDLINKAFSIMSSKKDSQKVKVLKWDTKKRGEIPADFGYKK